MSDKRTTTIELDYVDGDCIVTIQEETGIETTIGAIRYALRKAARAIKQARVVNKIVASQEQPE